MNKDKQLRRELTEIVNWTHTFERDPELDNLSSIIAGELGKRVDVIFGYGSRSVLENKNSEIYDLFVVVDYLWRFTKSKKSRMLLKDAKPRKLDIKGTVEELEPILAEGGEDGRKIPGFLKSLSKIFHTWTIPLAYCSQSISFLTNLLLPPNTYQIKIEETPVKINVISRSHLKKIAKGKRTFLERRLHFDDWYMPGRMNKVLLPSYHDSEKSQKHLAAAQAGSIMRTTGCLKEVMLRQDRYSAGFTRAALIYEYLSLSYIFEGREDFDFNKLYNSNPQVKEIYNKIADTVLESWQNQETIEKNKENGNFKFTTFSAPVNIERQKRLNKKFSEARYYKSGLVTYDAEDSIEIVARKMKIDESSLEGNIETKEGFKQRVVSLASNYIKNRKNKVV